MIVIAKEARLKIRISRDDARNKDKVTDAMQRAVTAAHHKQKGVGVFLGLPTSLTKPSTKSKLGQLHMVTMCRLTTECSKGTFKLIAAVDIPEFFPNRAAVEKFCGYPGGYTSQCRVTSKKTRVILRSDTLWEQPWNELLHLPTSAACYSNFMGRGDGADNGTETRDGGANGAPVGLEVPLLELQDVYLGGQFVPFRSDGRAFVPLYTAEDRGGLMQGVRPGAGKPRGPIEGFGEECCFPKSK